MAWVPPPDQLPVLTPVLARCPWPKEGSLSSRAIANSATKSFAEVGPFVLVIQRSVLPLTLAWLPDMSSQVGSR